ncbi:MAG TPA: EF-hand domain-containing protein [Actinomycetota bacterium]|jgi:Ca2+-binding EF-hand superfamily protein|nr:EF-hand domain-containing protein [Actinomycetota bacterium]
METKYPGEDAIMLSEFRSRKVASGFAELDANEDGHLERGDIETLVHSHGAAYGYEPGSPEYEELARNTLGVWDQVRQFDSDGDGQVTLEEYVAGFGAFIDQRDAFLAGMGALVDSFYSMADRDGDGLISEEELILHYRAWRHTEDQAREAFTHLDRGGRGGISKQDWMRNLEEFYYSDDPEAPGNWLAPLPGA